MSICLRISDTDQVFPSFKPLSIKVHMKTSAENADLFLCSFTRIQTSSDRRTSSCLALPCPEDKNLCTSKASSPEALEAEVVAVVASVAEATSEAVEATSEVVEATSEAVVAPQEETSGVAVAVVAASLQEEGASDHAVIFRWKARALPDELIKAKTMFSVATSL